MSDKSADKETLRGRALYWAVKLLVWGFYAWMAWVAWTMMKSLWAGTTPDWAKSIAGGVFGVGGLVWHISKSLERQQQQLDRIEAMLLRLTGANPTPRSTYDDY
jgi:TRAP-type C4-dicarboxylate transport system permease small subunit